MRALVGRVRVTRWRRNCLLRSLQTSAPVGSYDTACVQTAWDFSHGGRFPLDQAQAARSFFREQGFVVFTDVMSEEDNGRAVDCLVADIHEINPSTVGVSDPSQFAEADLPTSPNQTFRTTCNIAFGRFAWAVRVHPGVRRAFASIHEVPTSELACSWDNPFFTPQPDKVTGSSVTQLHWDHNWYYEGKQAPLADELCVQGVYYASPTDEATPAFVCVPGSAKAWRRVCELDANPAKQGARVLSYLPIAHFDDAALAREGLCKPVRIHVPARSLLLWDSRTCHGNTAPSASAPVSEGEGGRAGRVAFAICYGPVAQRSAAVHREGLLKGLAGIRTTNHPGIMLAHDKHGYPADFVSMSEPNQRLRDIRIPLNPAVDEAEFQRMLGRARLPVAERGALAGRLTLANVQREVYESYWRLGGRTEADCFGRLLALELRDLRRLLHPQASLVQGRHPSEA